MKKEDKEVFYKKFYENIPERPTWLTFNNIIKKYKYKVQRQLIIMEWVKHDLETFNSDYKYLENLNNEELSVYIYTTRLYMKINECLKNFNEKDMSINFNYDYYDNDKIVNINHNNPVMICANISLYIKNNQKIYDILYKGIRVLPQIGQFIHFNYFSSFTTDKNIAMEFAKENTLIIIYNAIAAPVKYSKYPNQRELLMGNNEYNYRVRVIRNGKYGVYREVLAVPMLRNCNVYIVQNGDNLQKIANDFNININILIQINHIDDPNMIYRGELLLIPKQRS